MKSIAFTASFAACVFASGVATATDLWRNDPPVSPPISEYTPPPLPLWTGLYVGGHIGGVWGKTDITDQYGYNVVDPEKTTNIRKSGLIGGAQLGFNHQSGYMVYGLEADLGGLNLSGDKSTNLLRYSDSECNGAGSGQKCSLNAKYSVSSGMYGDITGRLGYANDRSLFYVKGGAAFLNASVSANYVGANFTTAASYSGQRNPSTFNYETSETMWGWTVGAGIEYALTSSISLKAEYQHFDFGNMSYDHNGTYAFYKNSGISALYGAADTSITADAVTVGINYHFDSNYGPMK